MDESCFGTAGRKKARVEIIPLIDVVFFLLATFVLVVLTMQRLAGIELKLPVADKGKPIDDTIAFIEALDTNSYAWHVGRDTSPEYLTTAALGPKLEEYRRTYPVNRVLVRGSGKATFGATLRAVDEVRQAKISEVSIETTAK